MNWYRRGMILPAAGGCILGLLLILAIGGWRALAGCCTAIAIVTVSDALEDRRRRARRDRAFLRSRR